ncbi:CPBP family intramembrane glutamic endopeptidase [Ramlibacter algicola]|uniref:CPBP family intramembrane metalloprotease n=1 Tax=Ramlibacter algicola TaxID=2795217 RepID=A0A934UPN5_9BURK|nr:CPBP family intramembrane glutamic endopeptidase [Ramlibacter algicola]MBK0391749.1 CPBP family intramembrane metalloprotease [Ramlibacter algicola]
MQSLRRLADRHPVALAIGFAALQFALTAAILLGGRAALPPHAFGAVKLTAFASTIVLPLVLAHALGLWRSLGLEPSRVRPAPVFLAGLVLVAMNLSCGPRAEVLAQWPTDLAVQFFNAFGEELLFRGVIFALLLRLPVWQALLLNSVLFGGMHLLHGFMGLAWPEALQRAGLTMLGGALFTAVRYRSGSLWLAIALHMALNLSVMYNDLAAVAGASALAFAHWFTPTLETAIAAWVAWSMRRPAARAHALPSGVGC